jgi:predicted MPP superfamily phosphohydrolase
MAETENPSLPGIPRAGFLRGFTDYWWGARRKIVVTPYDIATPKLAPGQTLSIAVVSDIHADTRFMPMPRLRDVIARTNALQPDMIYVGGDLRAQNNAVMTPLELSEVAQALGALHAPLGVFATLGNHDWWDDSATQTGDAAEPETAQLLRDAGLRVLRNEAVELEHASFAWVAGLDSQQAFERPRRKHLGADDLDATLASVPDDALGILLAHEPDIFPKLAKRPVPGPIDLVLSGHTHGGQIRMFGRRPVVPSNYGERYAYGYTREAGRDLIVSGGLGCSAIPLRLGVLPEIVLVTLRHGLRGAGDVS